MELNVKIARINCLSGVIDSMKDSFIADRKKKDKIVETAADLLITELEDFPKLSKPDETD